LLLFALFYVSKLPEGEIVHENTKASFSFKALQIPQVKWAVVAQFFYVGAQVCVFSFFILYATHATGISEMKAAEYAGFGVGMAFMIGRFVGTFFMKFIKPPVLLAIYAVLCMSLSVLAMYITGLASIYIVISIAFFMSIMFPTIFSLGIKELGEDTKLGSSFIIMSIVGGAILPLIFGHVSDLYGNIQLGYIVPSFCFFVILIFAVHGHKISTLKK